MRKIPLILTLVLALAGAMAISAQAMPTLDFDCSPPTPGTISWGGLATNALLGQLIQVDTVTGIDTPLHSGVTLTIINGLMNFATGQFAGSTSGEIDFNVGGSMSITGLIPAQLDFPGTFGNLLFNASFVDSPLPHVVIGPGGGTVVGNFTDEKDPLLAGYFGLTPDFVLGGKINLSFTTATPIVPGFPFTSTAVLSGDIANSGTPIPIPASALLLGSGLLGLVGLKFRKD